jgi:hypothetical protein
MGLSDMSLAHRANLPMRSHESRRLRKHIRVLRKRLLPPDVKAISGKIQRWIRVLGVRPGSRRKVQLACWVVSHICHVFYLPILCFVTKVRWQSAL